MNDKDLDLDVLENADDETVRIIAADCPASDEEKERMFAMSRKIYKERTKESNNINTETLEVSGVEKYRKPIWQKFVAAAAALALTAGAVTGGVLLFRKGGQNHVTNVSENETAVSPFGDLSGHDMRIMTAAVAPQVFIPKDELRTAMVKAFNEGEWTEVPVDTPVPDGESVQIFFRKAEDVFSFVLYGDGTILCDNGETQSRWRISEDIQKAVYAASEFDIESGDVLLYISEPYDDLIHKVWEATAEMPQTTAGEYVNIYDPIQKNSFETPRDNFMFILTEHSEAGFRTIYEMYGPYTGGIIEIAELFAGFDWKEMPEGKDYPEPAYKAEFNCRSMSAGNSLSASVTDQGIISVSDCDENGNIKYADYDVGKENTDKVLRIILDEYETVKNGVTPDKLINTRDFDKYVLERNLGESNNSREDQRVFDEAERKEIRSALTEEKYEGKETDINNTGRPVYRVFFKNKNNRDNYMMYLYDDNEVSFFYHCVEKSFKVSDELYKKLMDIAENKFNSSVGDQEDAAEIPGCANMQYKLAQSMLEEIGYNVEICKVKDIMVEPGYVIRTDPQEGTEAAAGSTVKLYVSMEGTGAIPVENYIDLNVDDAIVRASYRGFKVNTEEVNSDKPVGTVVDQSLKEGSEAESGSSITLYISNGNGN